MTINQSLAWGAFWWFLFTCWSVATTYVFTTDSPRVLLLIGGIGAGTSLSWAMWNCMRVVPRA